MRRGAPRTMIMMRVSLRSVIPSVARRSCAEEWWRCKYDFWFDMSSHTADDGSFSVKGPFLALLLIDTCHTGLFSTGRCSAFSEGVEWPNLAPPLAASKLSHEGIYWNNLRIAT